MKKTEGLGAFDKVGKYELPSRKKDTIDMIVNNTLRECLVQGKFLYEKALEKNDIDLALKCNQQIVYILDRMASKVSDAEGYNELMKSLKDE